MDSKSTIRVLLASLFLLAYLIFSALIKDTELIWILTRAMGLLSYALLFASVALGEWRLITKGKSEFRLFRYHHGISIASMAVIFAHFIAAYADNYKWGKTLTFIQYLGFSFSNKWLAFLSLGTLAFYLLTIVAATSSAKVIRGVGFRGWKVIHYLSYVAFFIAYVHAVNLGTDIKTSAISTVLHPMVVFSFIVVLGLLITKVVDGLGLFSDMAEATLAAVFFVLVLSGTALLAHSLVTNMGEAESLRISIAEVNESQNAQLTQLQALSDQAIKVKADIAEVRNGRNT